jgi:hypothetical protein
LYYIFFSPEGGRLVVNTVVSLVFLIVAFDLILVLFEENISNVLTLAGRDAERFTIKIQCAARN